jgi:hypothetical protein
VRLTTERLELFPLDVRALDAWVAGDVKLLREITGVQFQPVAPPLLDEDLRKLRDMVAGAREAWYWAVWAFALRETGEPWSTGTSAIRECSWCARPSRRTTRLRFAS